MSNPRKYKIVIVETGVGDPFLLGKFQFGTGNGITVPSEEYPLLGLQIKIEFSNSNNSDDFQEIGTVNMANPFTSWVYDPASGQSPVYYFGLPFDPRSYTAGQTVYLKITCSCASGDIQMDNGSNNHSTYLMNYSNSSDKDFPPVPVYYFWEA